jgi:hypothetical protein
MLFDEGEFCRSNHNFDRPLGKSQTFDLSIEIVSCIDSNVVIIAKSLPINFLNGKTRLALLGVFEMLSNY